MLVVFSPIFVAGTKIIFRDDSVAPLKGSLKYNMPPFYLDLKYMKSKHKECKLETEPKSFDIFQITLPNYPACSISTHG